MKRGIYVASKTKHAARWRHLRAAGLPIVSSWIDEAEPHQSPSLEDLWRRNVDEASTACALLVYVEANETMKGALVEIGAALARGVPVFWVGPTDGPSGEYTVSHHRLVRKVVSIAQAVREARHLMEGL